MGFTIHGKDNKALIFNLEDWKRYSPPVMSNHWVKGRSAMELAKSWLDDEGPKVPQKIKSLFENSDKFGEIAFICGFAEKETPFNDTPRGPRNHDLLVEANHNGYMFVIGIEGKEREEYGDILEERIKKAKIGSPNTQLPNRINEFCIGVLGNPYYERFKNIRYQFLSGIAGTMVEMEKKKGLQCAFVIQQLISRDTPTTDIQRNKNDFNAFMKHLSNSNHEFEDNFLHGPFNIPGSNLVPAGNLFIGKVTTYIS